MRSHEPSGILMRRWSSTIITPNKSPLVTLVIKKTAGLQHSLKGQSWGNIIHVQTSEGSRESPRDLFTKASSWLALPSFMI